MRSQTCFGTFPEHFRNISGKKDAHTNQDYIMDDDDLLKKDRLPGIPQVETVVLVNNFITTTMEFANIFASSCEEKLTKVSQRLSDVELALALFEAKLNSVPDNVDIGAPPVVEEEPTTKTDEPVEEPPPPQPEEEEEPPPPEPVEEEEPEEEETQTIPIREHPTFASFFRLQRLGVPEGQIRLKMQAEGVDPSILIDPERQIEPP